MAAGAGVLPQLTTQLVFLISFNQPTFVSLSLSVYASRSIRVVDSKITIALTKSIADAILFPIRIPSCTATELCCLSLCTRSQWTNKQTMRRCIYVLAFTMWQRLIGWPWLRKHLYPMCCLFLAKAKESIHHAAACTAHTETNRRNGIHRMATGHFARCVSSKSSANAACEWVAQIKKKTGSTRSVVVCVFNCSIKNYSLLYCPNHWWHGAFGLLGCAVTSIRVCSSRNDVDY